MWPITVTNSQRLNRRITVSDKTLVEALAKAQSEMDAPVKDKKNPQFGSLYASLGSIITAVKPA